MGIRRLASLSIVFTVSAGTILLVLGLRNSWRFSFDRANGELYTSAMWARICTGANPITWSSPELELDTPLYISAFGEDEGGELYVLDYDGGTIRRLADVRGPATG